MRAFCYLTLLAAPAQLQLSPAAPAGAQLLPPAVLQAQVEAFAGQPATVDPRLLLPMCARADLAWAPGGRSVMVHCPAPEWRVFVPVGGGAAVVPAPLQDTAPAIRRGDRVTVEAGGEGFVIAMEAVAEADSRDGRVPLRPVNGGRRLVGRVDADGRVRIHGLKPMVNGR
ncbi:MAG: flagella basal body P-ring formation protein FlgA [Polymorphobacter sp.]